MRKSFGFQHSVCGFVIACAVGLILPLFGERSFAAAPIRSFHGLSPTQYDLFGSAVAVDGNVLAVGSPGNDTSGMKAGQVELFDLGTGALLQTLAPVAPDSYSRFGQTLAIKDNLLAVGAAGQSTGFLEGGRVDLYDVATGAQLRNLVDPQAAVFNQFGTAVAIDGGRVLVSAPGTDTTDESVGQAYLFDGSTGAVLQTFAMPSPSIGSQFGSAVAMQGNRVVIGAIGDSSNYYLGGKAYLFDATTGDQLVTFSDPTPGARQNFGRRLALDGDRVLISDQDDSSEGSLVGRVELFDANTGALIRTFIDPDPVQYDNFGWSVALRGNLAIIASRLDANGVNGDVSLFNVETGELLATLTDPDPTFQDFFGEALTISGDTIAIGALGDDTFGENRGQVHVYAAVPEPGMIDLIVGALSVTCLTGRKRSLLSACELYDGH